MIAVIFEVHINEGKQEEYLQTAAELREHLAQVDGFISIERFASLSEEGKLCSLSFWEDEASIKQWREFEMHRLAQKKGKAGIFADFRIRVAEVVRDYGMEDRREAPE
ncbi:MAG: antibiotic biosynthesis monooxygenase [Deltaproteobacteria bacterium]|nr:antibiotic biosynthesis monooxygenase [Deltaproteobacteria bacterium]